MRRLLYGLAVVLLLGGCSPVQLVPFVSPVPARPGADGHRVYLPVWMS